MWLADLVVASLHVIGIVVVHRGEIGGVCDCRLDVEEFEKVGTCKYPGGLLFTTAAIIFNMQASLLVDSSCWIYLVNSVARDDCNRRR